jgi:hypothetical protein
MRSNTQRNSRLSRWAQPRDVQAFRGKNGSEPAGGRTAEKDRLDPASLPPRCGKSRVTLTLRTSASPPLTTAARLFDQRLVSAQVGSAGFRLASAWSSADPRTCKRWPARGPARVFADAFPLPGPGSTRSECWGRDRCRRECRKRVGHVGVLALAHAGGCSPSWPRPHPKRGEEDAEADMISSMRSN